MALGTAHGKILLFGEHAAVYGHPALGLTLDLETRVDFTKDEKTAVISGVPPEHLEGVKRLVATLGRALGLRPGSVEGRYRVSSTVPSGGGLGSSAALSAAAARAIAAEHSLLPSLRALWETANAGERLFHGTPSGIDTGLAIRTGLTAFEAFEASENGLPAAHSVPGCDAVVLVATSPRIGSTESLVGSIREKMEAGDPGVIAAMAALGGSAREAIRILASDVRNPGRLLGSLAAEAHAVLAGLGLSTHAIDRFLEAGMQSGALGGKMSGAGGGGASFLLYSDHETAAESRRTLNDLIRSQGLAMSIKGVYSLRS